MGFFSWDCKACGHSVRAGEAVTDVSKWLSEAVLVEPDGSTLRGSYNGYGRLESRSGRECEVGEGRTGPCLYHQACYDLMGKPSFDKPSPGARDQGFFVGEYDPKKPSSRNEVLALAKAAKEQAVADQKAAREAMAKYVIELEAKGEPVPEWCKAQVAPEPLISMMKATERS